MTGSALLAESCEDETLRASGVQGLALRAGPSATDPPTASGVTAGPVLAESGEPGLPSDPACCADSAPPAAIEPSSLRAVTDEQLLAQLQLGSSAAFPLLYRRHFPRARALALNITHDENDATEIVQDAFIRVLCHGSNFEGQSAFTTWLYRIVYNLAVDRLRRPYRKRTPIEQLDHWLGDLTPLALPGVQPLDPFEAASMLEAGRAILGAIERLPQHHRDVIVLRELQAMSYAEMAVALRCSKGTVMSRLFHARQRLQAMLRGLHDEFSSD